MTAQERLALEFLTIRGAASSADIRAALGVSQPTMSRILGALSDELVTLGAGKRTRYAVAHPIGTHPSQQPIWLVGEDGMAQRVGTLNFLAQSQVHVQAEGVNDIYTPLPNHPLPWYLSGLRAQGFLGRILAQRLSDQQLASNPETWDAHAVLLAALHTHDAPGALLLGAIANKPAIRVISLAAPGAVLDALSQDVARTLPTGSSAGGEQPKFPVRGDDGASYLVKFSPPKRTPFGDRWSDLLCAEALSSLILNRHGYDAAPSHIVQTDARTYLLSKRFDRCGTDGRRHVVSVGEAHAAFIKGPYGNWALTCDALVQQKRLSARDADLAHAMLQFGRLIGNTDMHSGNAGLYVQGQTLAELVSGNFTWAPVYDMLSMRWKPDPMVGQGDYAPFDVDLSFASASIRGAAADFWQAATQGEQFSQGFRKLAAAMVGQFR
jgi:hypothetical protein